MENKNKTEEMDKAENREKIKLEEHGGRE